MSHRKAIDLHLVARSQARGKSSGNFDESAINEYIDRMTLRPQPKSITVRNLDPGLKERLRIQAAQHGHSMEAEVRDILRQALNGPRDGRGLDLYSRIRARFDRSGGVDIEVSPREVVRDPPVF